MPTFSASALLATGLAIQADSTLVTENIQISLQEVSIAMPALPTPADYILKAESGDVEAQKYIAVDYTYGWSGFERNVEEAIKWYMRAVAQGDFKSLNDIAYLYRRFKYETHHLGLDFRSETHQGCF